MKNSKMYFSKFVTTLFLLTVFSFKTVIAAPIATATSDPNALIAKLLGENMQVQNVTITGSSEQIGIFSGANDIIGLDSGIVLSTGYANQVFNDNTSLQSIGTAGDTDLENINNGITSHDAISLEFDITSPTDKLSFQYLFASNEWNYGINDNFGLFINGINYALLPDSNSPVNIQSIKAQPQYLIDTKNIDNFEFQGRTKLLNCTAAVTPGQLNHVKICIADASDSIIDSAVFLKGGSLKSIVENPDTGDINLFLIAGTTLSSTAGLTVVLRKLRKKDYI